MTGHRSINGCTVTIDHVAGIAVRHPEMVAGGHPRPANAAGLRSLAIMVNLLVVRHAESVWNGDYPPGCESDESLIERVLAA